MDSGFKYMADYIRDEEPELAEDLIYALELVKTCYQDIQAKMKLMARQTLDENKYELAHEMIKKCEATESLSKNLEEQIALLIAQKTGAEETCQSKWTGMSHDKKKTNEEIQHKPDGVASNLNELKIEGGERHLASEDFLNTKPRAFMIGENVFYVDSWTAFTKKVCEYLISLKSDKMDLLADSDTTQGSKHRYLTKKPIAGKHVRISNTDIYVYVYQDANRHVSLAKMLLKEYGIPEEDLIIFLRKDSSR